MWTSLEPWQTAHLARLATFDHERVESALNDLWDSRPDLLEQITISAIDQEEISLDRGALVLRLSVEEVKQKLAEFHKQALKRCCVVICDGSIAKLADGGLPVWEVVRVHRKVGSVEKLQEAFCGVSRETLNSALAYADGHPEEIELQISRYEQLLDRRKAEYPYAK